MLIILFIAGWIIFTSNNSSDCVDNTVIENEGFLTYSDNKYITPQSNQENTDNLTIDSNDSNYSSNSENTSNTSNYVQSTYAGNKRGNTQNLDTFFQSDLGNASENNNFVGNNEGGDNLANYVSGPKKTMTDADKFNASDLLPVETNKDWFEDVQTTTIKNSHMINIYRPIGVNTISTTLKNPSHDVRGTPSNPKKFVSPWNMSSYESDNNLNRESLCY
jgi:hypothetical protein